MGKIKQGILGGFNGTTGSVVGASWKGIAYMRGKAQSIKNPRTEAQMSNRTLFGRVSDIMSKALVAVRYGFLGLAVKKSAFNCAVQSSLDVINAEGGDFDYSLLRYSGGSLQPFLGGTTAFADNTINVTASFAIGAQEAGTGCCVAVFEGDYPGAPIVQVRTVGYESGASSCQFGITVPNGIEYTRCHLSVFAYNESLRISSDTTYIGSYTPA